MYFFLQVLIMLSLVAIQSLLFILPTISGQVHHQSTGTSPVTKDKEYTGFISNHLSEIISKHPKIQSFYIILNQFSKSSLTWVE